MFRVQYKVHEKKRKGSISLVRIFTSKEYARRTVYPSNSFILHRRSRFGRRFTDVCCSLFFISAVAFYGPVVLK